MQAMASRHEEKSGLKQLLFEWTCTSQTHGRPNEKHSPAARDQIIPTYDRTFFSCERLEEMCVSVMGKKCDVSDPRYATPGRGISKFDTRDKNEACG